MCNLWWTHTFSLDFKIPAKGPVLYLREEEEEEEEEKKKYANKIKYLRVIASHVGI